MIALWPWVSLGWAALGRGGGSPPVETFRLLDDNAVDHLMDDDGTTFLTDD